MEERLRRSRLNKINQHLKQVDQKLRKCPQFKVMEKDIKDHGSEKKGEYKNIKWSARRLYGTYWCGYIHYTAPLSNKDIEILGQLSHGGLTDGLDFNCAHVGDFAPSRINSYYYSHILSNCVFRTFEYTKQKIYNMIDYIDESR